MHNALSYPRVHTPKSHIVGFYFEEERDWWNGRCVSIDVFRSVYARTMGVADPRNRAWLWPEEGLYLLERGSLDIRWVDSKNGDGNEEGSVGQHDQVEEENGDQEPQSQKFRSLPMSLQGAYADLMGKSGLTLMRYVVFAGLRRSGYVVTRASTWDDEDGVSNGQLSAPSPPPVIRLPEKRPESVASATVGLFARLVSWLLTPRRQSSCPAFGPLVAPGLYRNYNDIFRALSLIPHHDASTAPSQEQNTKAPFRIVFNVWKPNTPYKKSSPPPPDFCVAVVDARESTVPTVEQIGALLDTMPFDELPKDKRFEQRIKHGRKNVILAVVDCGVVSYLRFSEASIGSEKLYEQKTGRHIKKRGGRGKGKRR